MKYSLILSLIIPSFLFSAEILTSEEIKDKRPATIQKVEFENHTYIRYLYHWNSDANKFFHDPGCICNKNILEVEINDIKTAQ